MGENDLILPRTVDVDGVSWRLTEGIYKDVDGRQYAFYFYALDRHHASYIIEDVRRTATLEDGNTIERIEQ